MKRILVTGAAGFIGSFLVKALAEQGNEVVGIDNLNDYYDVNLKYGRLKELCGIQRENIEEGRLTVSTLYSNYRFVKGDITDRDLLAALFDAEHFDIVCNLAAQAGVRYSLVNPYAYAESNLMGFLNILEACRHHHIEHLVYATYFSSPQTKFSKQISISAVVHYKQFENFPMSLPLKLFGNQSFYLDIFV